MVKKKKTSNLETYEGLIALDFSGEALGGLQHPGNRRCSETGTANFQVISLRHEVSIRGK